MRKSVMNFGIVYVEDSIRRKRLKYARGYEDCKVDQIFEAQLPKDLFMRHCDRVNRQQRTV